MNNSLKNVFSFIKEALELKNKNIYSVKDYEIHLDFGTFYEKFKELIEIPEYSLISINSDNIVFKLKYIKEELKKKYPPVPDNLTKYIYLNEENDIIEKFDDIETELLNVGFLEDYAKFEKTIKNIDRYNDLIDRYNSHYMQFYNVYKRINDYEEKIEVILGQKLLVWIDNKDNKIERYILEANLDLNVDPVNNIISFSINKDKFRGFVSDFLNIETYKIKEITLFHDFVKEFNENLEDDTNIEEAVKKYINYISIENHIQNRELENGETIIYNQTYLYDNIGILVRNKNVKLWIEDLEKIVSMCNDTKFKSPILNMFEVDFSNEEQVDELLNDNTYKDTKNDEVLFPLPSNEEQYKIVDKVKSSNIVLVQGPPGTGKSHTIANLLSHYISEGKKVIVTSEKAKALEVLRDKIPEQIRSLSLTLLTSKGVDKDLEHSVETVLKHQVDKNELDNIYKNIESLNNKLQDIHNKKKDNLRKIIELMAKDTISHKEELNTLMDYDESNSLKLMDIALWLDKNRKFQLVPIEDIENYEYKDTKKFFDKLDDISDDIKNNHYAISTKVPVNSYLNSNDIELYIKEYNGYKNYNIHNKELRGAIRQTKLTEAIVEELKEESNKIAHLYNFFDKEWLKSNVSYEVFLKKITTLCNTINANKKFIIEVEEILYDYNVSFDDEENKDYYSSIIKNIINLYDDNNIHFFDKFKLNGYIKKLNGLLYNNKIITKENISKDDFITINKIIDYYCLIENIEQKMKSVLELNLFKKYDIQRNHFGKYLNEILALLDSIINFKNITDSIDNNLSKIINKSLFKVSYLDNDEEFIKNIIEDLKYYVTNNNVIIKTQKIIDEIRNYYKDYNLQSLNDVLFAIETNQYDDYINSKNKLLREINIINQFNNLKDKYDDLVRDKNNLIRKYIYDFDYEEKQFLKNNIDKCFKYHYIEKYYLLLEKKELSLPKLYEIRDSLIKEEKKIIERLVTTKGWFYQSKNMNHNISTSLNKWINLKKKLGAMTGKNTNLYLRQMREEMNTAKNAIPVWIMPVDKLIEQYPFTNEPPFDVLIMDESSQSSVYSISALSRAKKIIIVGDDKQISPTNAFTSIEGINDLRAKYLKNNSWDLQISRDTSIYDIVQTICGNKKITLTEHFRCLPEIINYSNKEFYNMEINPLKVRGKENTIKKPIRTIYVPNATCKKIGAQVFNQTEIDRIIMLIGEIANDSQYENKTIGIIALQNSSKYIQKLTELLMQKFGEKFISERKIKVGTTYDFQGDERDVIILGMVISSINEQGDKYNFKSLTKQEFNKSFNVAASRAKEQMILIHSVKLEELSPNCNRYRLLNYCLNYDKEKEIEYEKLFESEFEKDFYNYMTSKNYKLIPQFKVGNYRLDFVLTNDDNQKIAIECDGDIYHGIPELENDLKRQSILERCGWKFARIRASEFYYNREESVNKLISTIEQYLNNNNTIKYNVDKRLDDINLEESKEIVDKKVFSNLIKENPKEKKDNINRNCTKEENNTKNEEDKDNHPNNSRFKLNEDKEEIQFKPLKINNVDFSKFAPSQFKYMVLYCEGITRREISDYYKVTYDTVKKSLQTLATTYKVNSIDECVDDFKKTYSKTTKYLNIKNHYYNSKNKAVNNNKYTIKYEKKISDIQILETINNAIGCGYKIKIIYSGINNNKTFILTPIFSYKKERVNYLRAIDENENKVKLFRLDRMLDVKVIK